MSQKEAYFKIVLNFIFHKKYLIEATFKMYIIHVSYNFQCTVVHTTHYTPLFSTVRGEKGDNLLLIYICLNP